ncbi:hypothetical protein ACQUW5_05870 [Legionella sp. CNM-1927-20]|uniref:hypothetical protein n=1 Tax=Legionella sp. CNM-1927-20 TaxID=3422221 RepID=UPI00403B340A
MKCYVLATGSNLSNTTWSIPNQSMSQSNFFTKKFLERIKQDILSSLESLKTGTCHGFEKEGYYLYGQKTSSGFYGLACDIQLNKEQLFYLYRHLFMWRIAPALIAAELSKYTQDFRLLQAQAELEALQEMIKKNIERLMLKGENFERLMAKVEELKQKSSQFNHQAKMKEPSPPEPTQDYQVAQAKAELEETPEIMMKEIEEMIMANEPIELLLAKTEELNQISFQFNRKGKNHRSCALRSCNLI